jgi:hypothetical protein
MINCNKALVSLSKKGDVVGMHHGVSLHKNAGRACPLHPLKCFHVQ